MKRSLIGILGIALLLCSWTVVDKVRYVSKDPDIESIIRTSVLALRKQSELTVMSARLNSVATSSYTYGAMEAQQTDIQDMEVRYVVDLTAIQPQDVKVQGNEVQITIPDVKVIQPSWAYNPTTYTNGSLLFSWGDAKNILGAQNKKLILGDLDKQAKAFIPNAREAARQTIASLMQVPLDATASKYHVKVTMHL